MAFRLYVVPVIGTGTTVGDPRRPKYFTTATLPWTNATSSSWVAIDYGFEPRMVVGADLSVADDISLTAQPDVTALPFDLDPLLTAANVTAIKNKLEAANIPAQWVNTTLTWRDVVRTVLGVFSFMQRYGKIYAQQNGDIAPPSLFISGITLDSTFGSLPVTVQTALTATATDLGIDTTGLVSTTTVRQMLKSMANHFQGTTYSFGMVAV